MSYKDLEKEKQYQREYHRLHKESISKRVTQYKKINKEKLKLADKKYYIANRIQKLQYSSNYKKANRDTINAANKIKRQTNIQFRIRGILSTRISLAVKAQNSRKSIKNHRIIRLYCSTAKNSSKI